MASTLKRKWTDSDDEDDEEPTLGRRALPVANLPDDFDGVPMDGMQYLFTVRRDARRLPRITRVPNPYEVEQQPLPEPSKLETASDVRKYLPSEEWQDAFLKHFKNFRQNILQSTIHVDPPGPVKLIPNMKDRDAWWTFISGRPEPEWNPPKKPKASKQKSKGSTGLRSSSMDVSFNESQIASSSAQTWIVNDVGDVELVQPSSSIAPATGDETANARADPTQTIIEAPSAVETLSQREPTPTLLRGVDHRYALHLLMYFAHWINLNLEQPHPRTSHITETHARWMFSLLARVEDYVSADEMSTLRSLARGCMGLLKDRLQHYSETDSAPPENLIGESSCWMIITAVIGRWAQRDLWMDAEGILSEVKRSVS